VVFRFKTDFAHADNLEISYVIGASGMRLLAMSDGFANNFG
jgi:hypothetical protein